MPEDYRYHQNLQHPQQAIAGGDRPKRRTMVRHRAVTREERQAYENTDWRTRWCLNRLDRTQPNSADDSSPSNPTIPTRGRFETRVGFSWRSSLRDHLRYKGKSYTVDRQSFVYHRPLSWLECSMWSRPTLSCDTRIEPLLYGTFELSQFEFNYSSSVTEGP